MAVDDELDARLRELAGSGLDASNPSVRYAAVERTLELLQEEDARKHLAETWNGKR